MPVIITISGADKTGALARISTFLARKGYAVKGHHIAESASGVKLLKISLDATQIDKDKLSAEIKALNPEYTVVNVANAALEGAQPQSALIKEMASHFPHIAPLVQAYGKAFGSDTRDKELFEAGKKIGAFIYTKEWSFGSPLKMPAALRRALVPALEKFGKVEATDTSVALPNSPFCGVGNQINCCEFLTGFSQGFLNAGPSTKNTHVQKVACRAKGDLHCAYTFDYTV